MSTSPFCDPLSPSRRAVLGAAGGFFAWSFAPKFAFSAGGKDPRLVVIVLRGALDGMALAAPVGDPDYGALRESIALQKGGPNPALALDGFFALHPAMPHLSRLYAAKQALIVHACATGYRERSHFDGQDVLESGQPKPGLTQSGWLNRALEQLPKGEAIGQGPVLGVGPLAPLIARGAAPVTGWAPPMLARVDDGLAARVLDLYTHTDKALLTPLMRGLETDKLASTSAGDMRAKGSPANAEGMITIATGAARLMAAPAGPRIAALAFEGWDTHANQGAATGQLANRLAGLDGALGALENGLGPVWKDTVVAVITEFGRTARINGTTGSDHGTATAAILAGGAANGGRIEANWPGLKTADLFEGRDLRPTTDLRAVLKGVLAEHLGLSPKVLAEKVFPGTEALVPLKGLVRT